MEDSSIIRRMSNIENVLNAFGTSLASELERGIPEGKDATHNLRNSILPSVALHIQKFGFKYTFQFTLADYYKYVDEGRRPGSPPPPVSNILQWMRDKRLIITRGQLRVRKNKSDAKIDLLADGARSLQMAFAISRSISKRGIKPLPFFTSATRQEIWDKLQADLTEAAGKDIQIEIRQGLKEAFA